MVEQSQAELQDQGTVKLRHGESRNDFTTHIVGVSSLHRRCYVINDFKEHLVLTSDESSVLQGLTYCTKYIEQHKKCETPSWKRERQHDEYALSQCFSPFLVKASRSASLELPLSLSLCTFLRKSSPFLWAAPKRQDFPPPPPPPHERKLCLLSAPLYEQEQ